MRMHHFLGLAALVAASAAGATLAGASDTIQGCVRKDSVLVIATAEQCKTLGQPLVWNVQGPPGPKGDPGTKLTSIDDLNGLTCSSGDDGGEISVSVADGGDVTLECSFTSRGPVLRINEVMTGSPISAASEFVEIVNTGLVRADFGGYRLVYRSATGTTEETLATVPAGAAIEPGARYVFRGTTFGGTANQTYNSGLASTAGGVGLRNSSGQLIDSVGYGNATNALVEGSPAVAPKPGTSISRLPDGRDSNVNAGDFLSTSPPTPGAVNHR
jgi:Lamin Tail Domain